MTIFETFMVWTLMALLTLAAGWTVRSFALYLREHKQFALRRRFAASSLS